MVVIYEDNIIVNNDVNNNININYNYEDNNNIWNIKENEVNIEEMINIVDNLTIIDNKEKTVNNINQDKKRL